MKKLALAAVAVLVLATFTAAQDSSLPRHMSPPPVSMNPDNTNPTPDTPTLDRHIDLLELQKEANDLARAAQSIPIDLENVRRGMLPKDVLQKLKQIEKLSKHLRAQLGQ